VASAGIVGSESHPRAHTEGSPHPLHSARSLCEIRVGFPTPATVARKTAPMMRPLSGAENQREIPHTGGCPRTGSGRAAPTVYARRVYASRASQITQGFSPETASWMNWEEQSWHRSNRSVVDKTQFHLCSGAFCSCILLTIVR
jgi:hypothetical protein